MTFRVLTRNDIEYILLVQSGNFADGWNAEMLKSAFNEGRFYAIALEKDGVPVGLITFSVAVDTADIEGVVVINEQREKGFGTELITVAEDKMKALNVVKSFLEVRESNVPAIRLYQKCGYEKISVRKNYYADGENAVVMAKELL